MLLSNENTQKWVLTFRLFLTNLSIAKVTTPKMKIKRNKKWSNTIKKFGHRMPYYCIPRKLQDLIDLVQRAEKDNKQIKAVGSGHSFSDVAIPEHYLVDLRKMDALLPLNRSTINQEYDHLNLVHVEAGMTIQKFNKKMDHQGLCIKNMGGIDDQTLAGAVSTGTHGTGIDLPSLPGMVRSILIVTHAGKCLRIEPANGLTNPSKHDEQGIELVQNDKFFYSTLISLGCFGLIYSFVLEMEDMYHLEETKTLEYWKNVKLKLEDRSLFKEPNGIHIRGVMIQINPYLVQNDDHTCIVVRHRLLTSKPRRSLADATRNWISSIAGSIPISYLYLRWVIRKRPHKIPKIIELSLKSLRDKRYVNKGYRVLYQGAEYIKKRAYDSEFAFDLSNGKNNFVKALDALLVKAAENKKQGIYQTSPMGLRFVDKSPAYLSPEYNKKVVYIDTPFIQGTVKLDEQLHAYQKIMATYDGIPHWGKINTIFDDQPELIIEYYPKLKEWQEVFKKLNPQGRFSNRFSDRLNLGSI